MIRTLPVCNIILPSTPGSCQLSTEEKSKQLRTVTCIWKYPILFCAAETCRFTKSNMNHTQTRIRYQKPAFPACSGWETKTSSRFFKHSNGNHLNSTMLVVDLNPYPTAFPYGNGMVLHFYQQQESSTTKTVHRVINKGLKTYV